MARTGDQDTLKDMTIGTLGMDNEKAPLLVAIQDKRGFSPFSIAVFRHHFDTAKTILGIAKAQFKSIEIARRHCEYVIEQDKAGIPNVRYNALGICFRVTGDKYTCDNFTAPLRTVGSKVSRTY